MDIKLKAWCDVGYNKELRDSMLTYINSHCQIRTLTGKPVDTNGPYARYLALFDGGGVNAFGSFCFKVLMGVPDDSLKLSVEDFKTLCCMTHGTWEAQTYLTQVGVAPHIKTVDDLIADIETEEPMGMLPDVIAETPPTPPDGDKPMAGTSFSFSRDFLKTSYSEEGFQHLKFEKYSDLKELVYRNISAVIDSLNADGHLYDFAIEGMNLKLREIHAAISIFKPESPTTPVGNTKDSGEKRFVKNGNLHKVVSEVEGGFIVCNVDKQFRFFMKTSEFKKLISDEKPLDSKWRNVRKLEEEFKDSSCSENSLNCGEIVVPIDKMYNVNDDVLKEHMKLYESSEVQVGDSVYSNDYFPGEIKRWEVRNGSLWFMVEFDFGEVKWYKESELKDCVDRWEVE